MTAFINGQAQTYEILQESFGDLDYFVPSKGKIVISDSTCSFTYYKEDSGKTDTTHLVYTIVKREGGRYTLKSIFGEILCVFTEPEDKREKKKGTLYLRTIETNQDGSEMKWKYILRKLD